MDESRRLGNIGACKLRLVCFVYKTLTCVNKIVCYDRVVLFIEVTNVTGKYFIFSV